MPTILHSLNHMVTPWWKKLAQHAGLSENVVFFKPPNFHKSSYIWWKSQPQKIFNETYVWHITGWWLSHPSENYEFVSWDDYSLWKHNPNVPNHQPVSYSPIINHYQPSLTMINHYWPFQTTMTLGFPTWQNLVGPWAPGLRLALRLRLPRLPFRPGEAVFEGHGLFRWLKQTGELDNHNFTENGALW